MSLLNLKMHQETAKVVFFELRTPWFRVKQDWGNIIIPYTSLQCQLWSYQVYWWFINPGRRRWQQCQSKYSKKMIFFVKTAIFKANLSAENQAIGRKSSRVVVFILPILRESNWFVPRLFGTSKTRTA